MGQQGQTAQVETRQRAKKRWVSTATTSSTRYAPLWDELEHGFRKYDMAVLVVVIRVWQRDARLGSRWAARASWRRGVEASRRRGVEA